MQCLRPHQRLLTAADYRKVFEKPDAKAGQRDRLGLAIAKKHVPLAVNRNQIKRIAREQFRHLLSAQPTLDIVILTRPGARDATRASLRKALEQLFQRLGLEMTTP
jgi:ribonuclease P protein component